MPDRRVRRGTVLDRSAGQPRLVHRADDVRTKWQFFAFAMTFFAKNWIKFTFLVFLIGAISFVRLRYTDLIDALVRK